jgi:hypothetical protein
MHNTTNLIAMLDVCQPQGHEYVFLKLLISLSNELGMVIYLLFSFLKYLTWVYIKLVFKKA